MSSRKLDICKKAAMEVLVEKGSLQPVLMVTGVFGNAVATLDFEEGVDKAKVMESVGFKTANLLPYEVIFVTEAWMSHRVPEEGQRVSEMPDREECIVILEDSADGRMSGCIIPFARIGKEIVFGESIESKPGNAESRITERYWKGVAAACHQALDEEDDQQPN
jgi:hypothetical protein